MLNLIRKLTKKAEAKPAKVYYVVIDGVVMTNALESEWEALRIGEASGRGYTIATAGGLKRLGLSPTNGW